MQYYAVFISAVSADGYNTCQEYLCSVSAVIHDIIFVISDEYSAPFVLRAAFCDILSPMSAKHYRCLCFVSIWTTMLRCVLLVAPFQMSRTSLVVCVLSLFVLQYVAITWHVLSFTSRLLQHVLNVCDFCLRY